MAKKRFSKKVKKAKAKKVRYSKKNNNPDVIARLKSRINSLNNLVNQKISKIKLRNRREYTQHDLEQAAKDVRENKLTYKAASEKYEVPESTIHNAVSGHVKTNQLGRATIISNEMEQIIVGLLIKLSDAGLGLTKYEILTLIADYLKKTNQEHLFKNGIPSDMWYRGFKKRWAKDLSPRMAQNLPINRAKGVNAETAGAFYDIVEKKKIELVAKYGPIPAENWWNTDESGYCGDQGNKVILCRKGIESFSFFLKFYILNFREIFNKELKILLVWLVTVKRFTIQSIRCVMPLVTICHITYFTNLLKRHLIRNG